MYLNMRLWQYKPIEMPVTKNGDGPAPLAEAAKILYEVWDQNHHSLSSHSNLSDAINAAIDLNMMNDPEFLLPSIKYDISLLREVFGEHITPLITKEDEEAMSPERIGRIYNRSSLPATKKTIEALVKYATVRTALFNADIAANKAELANAIIERDHYAAEVSKSTRLASEFYELTTKNATLSLKLEEVEGNYSELQTRHEKLVAEFNDLKMSKDLEKELDLNFDIELDLNDDDAVSGLTVNSIIQNTIQDTSREKHLGYNLNDLFVIFKAEFGFEEEKSLAVLDSLYEKKMITYPRTAVRHLTSRMLNYGNLSERLGAMKTIPEYSAAVDNINLGNISSVWVHDNGDHYAIIPEKGISAKAYEALNEDERKVFDAISTLFIGLFSSENTDKGFVGLADDVREVTAENIRLMQVIEDDKEEVVKLIEETEKKDEQINQLIDSNENTSKMLENAYFENEALKEKVREHEALMNSVEDRVVDTSDNDNYEVTLNTVESEIASGMNEAFLNGAAYALTQKFTRDRCHHLTDLISDIRKNEFLAENHSAQNIVNELEKAYEVFCENDFKNNFDEGLQTRNKDLVDLEICLFTLNDLIGKYDPETHPDFNSYIGENMIIGMKTMMDNYKVNGLYSVLKNHWQAKPTE